MYVVRHKQLLKTNSTLKINLLCLPIFHKPNSFMTPLFCMCIYFASCFGAHTFMPLDYWNKAIGTELVFNYCATGGLLSGLSNLL